MSGVRFTPNPRAARELLAADDMRRVMERVAQEGAENADARAPSILRHRGARIYGEAVRDGDEWVAHVAVRSPFWHFPEYGHSRYPPRPVLRPAVQQLISRFGGRFQSK